MWNGLSSKCAFPMGIFISENKNCASMDFLRRLLDREKYRDGFRGWKFSDDESAGSFGSLYVQNTSGRQGFYISISWYGNGGRTARAYRFRDDDFPRILTCDDIDAAVEAFKAAAR